MIPSETTNNSVIGCLVCVLTLLVYPKVKVKVRSQEQDIRYGGIRDPGLKAVQSLFAGDFCSSGKNTRTPTSEKSKPLFLNSCKSGSVTQLPASNDKNERGKEGSRTHIRASSIPRPRAVLSSPDNDGMIGSKSRKSLAERTSSALKPHHTESGPKCRVTPKKHSTNEKPREGEGSRTDDTKKLQLKNQKIKHAAADKSGRKEYNKGPSMGIRVRE